jgi:hypothetical protein
VLFLLCHLPAIVVITGACHHAQLFSVEVGSAVLNRYVFVEVVIRYNSFKKSLLCYDEAVLSVSDIVSDFLVRHHLCLLSIQDVRNCFFFFFFFINNIFYRPDWPQK